MTHGHHCSNDIYQTAFVFRNPALYKYHSGLSTTTQHTGVCSKPKNMAVSTTQGSQGDMANPGYEELGRLAGLS